MSTTTSKALPSPLERDGRSIRGASWPVFLKTAAVLPIWAVTVLPLSIVYQVGKASLRSVLPKQPSTTVSLDSGYQVDLTQVQPREKRKYDIVVLGATGFTGKLAARHLACTYGVNKTVKWAIAGRSQSKLLKVKKELSQELGMADIESIDTILVDTSVPSTLPKLVEQTRVVATTAGPYAFYGNSVVEFCSKFGTHYVDITGEVDWVRSMAWQWQETAQKSGSILISLCGNDSIPWDLSFLKLQELMKKECQDTLATVTFWDEFKGSAPGGTYATAFSIVEGKAPKTPKLAMDPFRRLPDGSSSPRRTKADLPSFIAKSSSPWDTTGKEWTAPFVMAQVNSQVVGWSNALSDQGSPFLVYKEFLSCRDFKSAFSGFAGLAIFGSMLLNPLTAMLVKRYAIPKPGEGPSMTDMEKKNFLLVKGEGIGSKGNRVESIMYFPKDPGCLETSRMMVEAGLCLALQEKALPNNTGGFWTPATSLGQILLDRLVKTGTEFSSRVVSVDQIRSKL